MMIYDVLKDNMTDCAMFVGITKNIKSETECGTVLFNMCLGYSCYVVVSLPDEYQERELL